MLIKITKSRNLPQSDWTGRGRGCWKMCIFKEYPPPLRWFLSRLKFQSYCYKGRGKQRSFWKILCLWHTELLNVELMPGSVVTLLPRLQQVQKPGGPGGSQKGHTPARLISGRRSCKLCTKQFHKHSGAHLRGKSCGYGITGYKGILNVCVKEKVVLTVQNQPCHLYHFHLTEDASLSHCFSIIHSRWALGTIGGDSLI